MTHPYDSIPELAGIATYEAAARVGYSVNDNVRLLLRYAWTERRLMRLLVAKLPWMPIWEAKCAMALHQWQSVEHVDALRARIAEMRTPVPNFDAAPEGGCIATLGADLDRLEHADDPHAFLERVYGFVYPTLAEAYREHLAGANPLVDYPTRRLLTFALAELDAASVWGRKAIAATQRAPVPRAADVAREPFHPRRDERFHGQYNFEFPPHVVYSMPGVPDDERNLALLCKRALEMDVPEMMASFMTERANESWEFYRDYSRQLWDEARHAMMGTVGLRARGIEWQSVPLNVSFALRLNLHATPQERQIMLYAIEQSLMPGETGKRFEYDTAVAAGDELSAHFQDYDWADEVLHAQIGRRMLKRDGVSGQEASDRAHDVHAKTWAALDLYRGREPQENWWPAFVRQALGKESAVADRAELGPINVFSE
jgi:hypothetical protein